MKGIPCMKADLDMNREDQATVDQEGQVISCNHVSHVISTMFVSTLAKDEIS